MAQCKWCESSGFFLSVDAYGLCRDCQPHLLEISSRAQVLADSMRLAKIGKTFDTRLSRCGVAIEQAEALLKFELKGVGTVSPSPSVILAEYRPLRTNLIIEEAEAVAAKAFEKAGVATSTKAKERALSAGLLKVREVAQHLEDRSRAEGLEQRLRREIHRVTLDGFLEAARKAEFKGNPKKAIDQYQEALYFIRNDGINDEDQRVQIEEIEARLKALGAGA
jgi:hypothetical protein